MSEQNEKSSDATHEADRRDAGAAHLPDREPTHEEEAAAEGLELDPEAAESYKEMARRGADQQGEGRIA